MNNYRSKKEEQTARIVAIARRLFAQKGVSETSLEDIAKVCGMRKASLYYYFKSKDEILQHVFSWHWKYNEALAASLKPSMSLEQILYSIGRNHLISMDQEENVEFAKIMIGEGLKNNNNKFHQAFVEFVHNRIPGGVFPQLLESKLKGRGTPEEIKMFFFQFIGALMDHAIHTKLIKTDMPFKCSDEKYLRQLCRIFTKGF